jgi:hypothetical protein
VNKRLVGAFPKIYVLGLLYLSDYTLQNYMTLVYILKYEIQLNNIWTCSFYLAHNTLYFYYKCQPVIIVWGYKIADCSESHTWHKHDYALWANAEFEMLKLIIYRVYPKYLSKFQERFLHIEKKNSQKLVWILIP